MNVSVAMAAYNGAEYISDQIESILGQLGKLDELIISLDASSDKTEDIITEYLIKDDRVKLIKNINKGVIRNFENAIMHCKNDIVFLADQDDIWVETKIKKQLEYFEDSSVGGVCHFCKYIDEQGKVMEIQPKNRKPHDISIGEILVKNPVQGSCLAFRREAISTALPFPNKIPMHDSWIGMWICANSRLLYIDEPLLLYRQHEGTVTVRKHKSLLNMLKDRLILFGTYTQRYLDMMTRKR